MYFPKFDEANQKDETISKQRVISTFSDKMADLEFRNISTKNIFRVLKRTVSLR